ncbi:hypothetical protein GU926_14880 [Nibribacter ruber]|uniref:DUF6970 domain-containing protein n=1 Tax=Nibribacter ruber TaxID=2698458 RepID=A0A6P1P2P3_9BACT|nr:hypothetical protein [Nibribacter ruber]QHL88642.1 hypothetical protein GU926_14880 [Nibribacter ruber]
MKHLYTLCLLFLVAFSSCELEEVKRTCDVARPTENIKWLRERVQELERSNRCQVVRQGTYNGHSVFVIGSCEPGVNSINSVYDCEGSLLCFNGDETCPDFDKEVKDLRVIWKNAK